MINLTHNERLVLIALRDNHYGDGDCTWSWAVDQSNSPTGLPPSSIGGVVGSLATKGLVSVDGSGRDSAIWVTAAGKEATAALA